MTKYDEFALNSQQRERILKKIRELEKNNFELKQALREFEENTRSSNDKIFLELLEILDGFSFLSDYLDDNKDKSINLNRFNRSLKSLRSKLLGVLEKREVRPISLSNNMEAECCLVVDQEVNDSFDDGSIVRIVREGYWSGSNVLRPAEVITTKK